MRFLRFKLLILALFCVGTLAAQPTYMKWLKPQVKHDGGDAYRITLTAEIEKGWHMYDLVQTEDGPNATIFTFKPVQGVKYEGKVFSIEKPVRVYDEMFEMEIGYYETRVTFVQKLKMTAERATVAFDVEWMLCNDQSCLPPDDQSFTVDIVAPAPVATAETPVEKPADNIVAADPAGDQPEETVAAEEPAEGGETAVEPVPAATQDKAAEITAPEENAERASLWALIIEAILWGFAALLTPCVFPMVPMTVSFFMKGSSNPAAGRFRAAMYGFFIIALYTLPIAAIILITRVVGGDAVTANIFNWISTHWLPNIIFFIVFMVFAASFFGAFEITMPSKLVSKSDKNADRGGLGGIFFMALTLVLVSFSCTGPIVGSVMIKSTTGEFWEPIVTMLAFSIAFALPFTLVAFFPSLLNKMRGGSGSWLNSVKVVLGFIEVALGFKFLSMADQTYHWGLLDREIYLAIWIVVFTLLGFYLLGKIRFKHDDEVKSIGIVRLALVILTFSFVMYMIPGMWGAPLKGLSGYLPPLTSQDFVLHSGPQSYAPQGDDGFPKTVKYGEKLKLPHDLKGFFDLEEAEAYARKVDKPLFVDLTGHACVNCREMESYVWSDPKVLDLLRNEFVVVALYVDDKKVEVAEEDWVVTPAGKTLKTLGALNAHLALELYNQNAQPYYVIQNADREILTTPHSYDRSIPAFVEFLEGGMKAYRENKK